MTKTIGLLPAMFLFCMTACQKEQTIKKIQDNTAKKALSPLIASPAPIYGTDWSGTVQIVIVTNEATGEHPQVDIKLPDGYALIGGGAVVTPQFTAPGALITASYPDADFTTWHAASKDQLVPFTHTLVGYAIGLKLTGMTKGQLISNMWIFSATSSIAPHPDTSVGVISSDYFLIGGGAKIVYGSGEGNLLVKSIPQGTMWSVSGKDHGVSDPDSITAYAIGIKNYISSFGTLEVVQDSVATYASGGFGTANVTMDSTWVVASAGGNAQYNGPGRMLTSILPGIRNVSVTSKDHEYPDSGTTTAYVVKIRRSIK
jgi:hypothetical protein